MRCQEGQRFLFYRSMISHSERARNYQKHLNGVSRSFAFAIEQLEMPLRVSVGLSYLIFRLLDTVEDALWSSQEGQCLAFEKFHRFIEMQPSREEVSAWAKEIPETISAPERELLNEADMIFRDFHEGPDCDREVIGPAVLSMSLGMQHFLKRKSRDGGFQLSSMADVDRYCFFVAGVVGDVLTGLVTAHAQELGLSNDESAAIPRLCGLHFGLFLQKINLLKDQIGDETEGRSLVPSRLAIWKSLKFDSESALDYIFHIPTHLKGYRVFCTGSLFLGLASLPWIETAYKDKSNAKIPRWKTLELMTQIAFAIDDNHRLKTLFDELWAHAQKYQPGDARVFAPTADEDVEQLLKLYQGPLEIEDLRRVLTSL